MLPVEIRYGWNIVERTWPDVKIKIDASGCQPMYCYAADTGPAAEGTRFAFEWTNPRLGQKIAAARLRRLGQADNPVQLHSVTVVGAHIAPAENKAAVRPVEF